MSGGLVRPAQFRRDFAQLPFPDNAQELLKKIEDVYAACKRNNVPWNTEALRQKVNLFVFNLKNAQDLTKTELRAVHKLRLANILLDYLALPRDGNDRFELFRTIFYSTNFQRGDVPLEILGLMACLAVAFQNLAVLETLALWMTTAGLENPSVIFIAMKLTNDFVTDEFPHKYNDLPLKAYGFTAILLVAIGKAYKNAPLPKQLIIQVATWIESTPNVCFIPPHSPIFDLCGWCINLQTFQENRLDKSRLHYAMISAIDKFGKGTQRQALPEILRLIQEWRVQRESIRATGGVLPPETLENAVDQLLQLVQLLKSAECLSVQEIRAVFVSLDESHLPQTKLYELLKATHLSEIFYTYREPQQPIQ